MRNIWIFAWKEFRLNIRSARFAIGLLLCLVIVPFTMMVGIGDYQIQKEVCEASRGGDKFLLGMVEGAS